MNKVLSENVILTLFLWSIMMSHNNHIHTYDVYFKEWIHIHWRISIRNEWFIPEHTILITLPSTLHVWDIAFQKFILRRSLFIEHAWHLLQETMELKYYAVFVLIVVLPKLLFCLRPQIKTGIFKVVKKHPNVRSCAEKILQKVNFIHFYSVSILICCSCWKVNVCIFVYANDNLFLLFIVALFGRTLWRTQPVW
jgi:hypothetical protein